MTELTHKDQIRGPIFHVRHTAKSSEWLPYYNGAKTMVDKCGALSSLHAFVTRGTNSRIKRYTVWVAANTESSLKTSPSLGVFAVYSGPIPSDRSKFGFKQNFEIFTVVLKCKCLWEDCFLWFFVRELLGVDPAQNSACFGRNSIANHKPSAFRWSVRHAIDKTIRLIIFLRK